jgi:uncharacterized protein YbjT (DUF2867 family)
MTRILVTGATGYIGGRLVFRLLEEGHTVRALARDPRRLSGRAWWQRVEVVRGDALDPGAWSAALDAIDTAYYLVHSMSSESDFADRDLRAAGLFAECASQSGLRRIIFLGGLGDPADGLSRHLRSRHAVGEALRAGNVPVIEFRASIVIGSGSASFEMLRYVVEGLPIIPCPAWVAGRLQPIGIEDVLDYLVAALSMSDPRGSIVEIGGQDVMSFHDLLMTYAQIRGLRRRILSPPLMPPSVCASIIDVLTPIPRRLAAPLLESLRYETVVHDDSARRLFPSIRPIGVSTALAEALSFVEQGRTETAWTDSAGPVEALPPGVRLTTREGLLYQKFDLEVHASAERLWRAIEAFGRNQQGRLPRWLWWIHGKMDSLGGGPGALRGRRHPTGLRMGDVIDYWRVDEFEPPKRLRLRGELRGPGTPWLEFTVVPGRRAHSRLVATTLFAPRGLPGILYWYALIPVRTVFFGSVARHIRTTAERMEKAESGGRDA